MKERSIKEVLEYLGKCEPKWWEIHAKEAEEEIKAIRLESLPEKKPLEECKCEERFCNHNHILHFNKCLEEVTPIFANLLHDKEALEDAVSQATFEIEKLSNSAQFRRVEMLEAENARLLGENERLNTNLWMWKADYAELEAELSRIKEGLEPKDIEYLSEQVHKAYCNYCLDIKGKEYWTKGDYSLLSDKVKEADRYTVVAVLKGLRAIRDKIWGGDDGDK